MKRLAIYALLASLLSVIVLNGGTRPIVFDASCIGAAIAAAIALSYASSSLAQRYAKNICISFMVLLCTYVFLQSVSFQPIVNGGMLKLTQELRFASPTSISVFPYETRASIPSLIFPVCIYVTCMKLFDDEAKARGLVLFLAMVSIAFSLFGMLQLNLFPDSFIFVRKIHYQDALTGMFINRNGAGSFIGISIYIVLFLMLYPDNGPHSATRLKTRYIYWGVLLLHVAALAMTRSRGAMLSLAAAMIVSAMTALVLGRLGGRTHSAPRRQLRRVAVPAAPALAIILAMSVFGASTIARFGPGSLDPDRLCVYEAAIRAISDNWALGTGFGTFQDVFPRYRDPDCGNIFVLFDRAHNSYLELAMGLGLIVAVPTILFAYVYLLTVFYRGYRTRKRFQHIPVLGFGATAFIGLHSLVDFPLQIPGLSAYFVAFLAAVTTICLCRSPGGAAEDVSMPIERTSKHPDPDR